MDLETARRMTEIALVDDHHLMRAGLVGMVNGMPGYLVTIESANGMEFIAQLRENQAPAIAIVDLNMPVMDGYSTMAWLRAHKPDILPLALTFDATDQAMIRAVRSGARGFVLKSARPQVLRAALDSLMRTGYYYTEESLEIISRGPTERPMVELEREHVLSRITPRELEFLTLVCDEAEHTYEQIAKHMDVTKRTVENYRVSLFDKFKIKSKTGLVLFAMRWGLVK